jgi:hypothetical protein
LNTASTILFSIGQSPLWDLLTMLFDPFRDFKVVVNRVSYLPIIPESHSSLFFVVKNWLSRILKWISPPQDDLLELCMVANMLQGQL